MLKSLINRIENTNLTFRGWIAGFLGILFVRIFLESFSNVPLTGNPASDAATIVHYYLFYLATVLSLLLLLGFFIGRGKAERFVLFGLITVWLAPILDLLISHGRGYRMSYIFADGAGLLRTFFSFFTTTAVSGVTPGMKIELFLIFFVMLAYVIYSTKNVAKGVLAVFTAYVVMFFWGSLPSWIKIFHDLFFGGGGLTMSQFFWPSIESSIIPQNFLHPTIHLSYIRGVVEVFFNVAISQVYYILVFILVLAYMFAHHREKLIAVLRNSRPLRVAHYFIMICLGLFLGSRAGHGWALGSWLDITSLLALFLSYYCAWMYAVGVNDIEDLAIDRISNPGRPLAVGALTENDVKNFNLFFLLWALLGGFLAGQYVLFMIITALSISHVYSAQPLRLRDFPLVATFLIALVSFTAVAAGFYLLSPDKTLKAFPISYALLVIVCGTLIANFKDIKDIKGDREAGAQTIPVIFGEKNGKRIIGVLAAAAFLAVPVILNYQILIWPSLIAAVAAYFLINRQSYKDWNVLLVCLLYVASVLLTFSLYGLPA